MSRVSKADIIEALLFASDKPLPLKKLAQIAGVDVREAAEELEILREEKKRIGALQIVEMAGGWQIVTKPDFSTYIKQLREVPRQRLSRAAFEVLAIVAYRQPVTRGEIESLRGVDCSGPIQFLLDKKLVHLAGRKEAPGRPWLYESTPQFLDHFGLRSIEDLPSLAEFTQLNEADAETMNLFNRPTMRRGSVNATTEDAIDDSRDDGPEKNGRLADAATAAEEHTTNISSLEENQ